MCINTLKPQGINLNFLLGLDAGLGIGVLQARRGGEGLWRKWTLEMWEGGRRNGKGKGEAWSGRVG